MEHGDAPLNPDALAARLADPRLDGFGPGSDTPALILELSGADPGVADQLRLLPCPVIGVGDGPLASACDVVLADDAKLDGLLATINRNPIAALILVQHLRAIETVPAPLALAAESLAYATLQMGPEFQRWQATHTAIPPAPNEAGPAVIVERAEERLKLTMNRPKNHNAIGVDMRDALCEGFELATIDPDIQEVELRGAGRCFSTGGEVREFGLVSDPATAHHIRSIRLPARQMLPILDRLTVQVEGAAIGSGAEIAAFGHRVVASTDAWFQLPELKYGLIPGAGGTVSLMRRMGRQRAAWLMLSMARINAQTALEWGLIDEILP